MQLKTLFLLFPVQVKNRSFLRTSRAKSLASRASCGSQPHSPPPLGTPVLDTMTASWSTTLQNTHRRDQRSCTRMGSSLQVLSLQRGCSSYSQYSQLCYHMTILRAAENACAVPDGAITDHRAYGEHGLRAQPWKMFSVTHLKKKVGT